MSFLEYLELYNGPRYMWSYFLRFLPSVVALILTTIFPFFHAARDFFLSRCVPRTDLSLGPLFCNKEKIAKDYVTKVV